MTKTPYDDRDDLEKLRLQWNKINGIIAREHEWSAAIVRAATAAEIAANIAIRKRFEQESDFSVEFVNSLLIWANGIDGKFSRLIIPVEQDVERRKVLQALKKRAEELNKKRNAIVHRGAFATETESRKLINLAREIVNALVKPWEPNFQLRGKKLIKTKKDTKGVKKKKDN